MFLGTNFKRTAAISALLSGLAVLISPLAAQATSTVPHSSAHDSELRDLHQEIARKRDEVAEFRLVREAAKELGLRVWLFGGTAAGFAHYVKWDMDRHAGDTRYVESRFDYDFTNIYRSTQDADLVVEGTVEDAVKLELVIREKLAHLQGAKDDWEVRLLRQDRGEKQALLYNPDFLNQHSDSNSTGMIELTDPKGGESVVRDLRDWKNNRDPQFLRDVAERKIHYYFSPSHGTTKLFIDGRNPEIFSVIRYFTKAFQYELEMRDEDLPAIRKIIDEFDYRRDLKNGAAQSRFEKIGSRLILHASNIEYAWDTLEKIGLRQKLLPTSDPSEVGKMGWWLNREPLRTKPVGEGAGRTLHEVLTEMGMDPETAIFSHETSDFLAWESITRDTSGRPNVLSSRPGMPGEAALHGEGHYTRLGLEGARGTGFTVRYKGLLRAREGKDFNVVGDYFVWQNRAALRVIPESLNISMLEYFHLVAEGTKVESKDRGMLTKLRKRLAQKTLTREEMDGLAEYVSESIDRYVSNPENFPKHADIISNQFPAVIREWFGMKFAHEYPALVEKLLGARNLAVDCLLLSVLAHDQWIKQPGFLEVLVNGQRYDAKAQQTLDRLFVPWILTRTHWQNRVDWTQLIVDRGTTDHNIAEHVLSQPWSANYPHWMETVIQRRQAEGAVLKFALSQKHWSNRPDFVRTYLGRKDQVYNLVTDVLSQEYWGGRYPEFVEELLYDIQSGAHGAIAKHLLAKPYTARYPQWMLYMGNNKIRPLEVIESALSKPHWAAHPQVLIPFLRMNEMTADIALDRDTVLKASHWAEHPALLAITKGPGFRAHDLRYSGRLDELLPVASSCDQLLTSL